MEDEVVYFIRNLLLLFKGGKLVCKGTLDTELKKEAVSLDKILEEKREKLKHRILKSQYSVLFPRHDQVNPEDFDLSLIIVVLLDVMNMPVDVRDLLKTIKEKRVEIIHGGKVKLSKDAYEVMRTSLTNSLSKLAERLSEDIQMELREIIKTFLTEPFGGRKALRYVEGIKNEEEILQWVHGKVEELVEEITIPECQMIENMKRDQEIVLDKLIKVMEEFNDDKKNINGPKKRGTSSDIYCMKCDESYVLTQAIFYCVTCSLYLCEECDKFLHVKSLKLSMKNHHKTNAKSAAGTVDMKGMDICNTHNEILTLYCKTHKHLCCEQCKNKRHDRCIQLCKIDDVAKHSFNVELNPVAEIEKLQRQIEDMEQWMTSLETKMNKQLQTLPSKLKDKRTKMLEAFDKNATLLKENAEIIHREKMETIAKNRSQFRELIQKSDQAKKSLKLIEASGTVADRFIAQHFINSRFKTFVSTFDDIKDMYEKAKEFDDFKSIDTLKNDIEPLSLD